MKRLLIYILFFLLFINVLKSQDTTFNKLYRLYDRVSTIKALISADDAYFALFGDLDANSKQNYGMLKFDKSGNIIDSSLILVDNKYWGVDQPLGHGFILTSDSCFLYCGGIKDTAGWVRGFLAKFDYNMDTIWTKIFYHPDTIASLQKPTTSVMHLTDVKETPDGNYILTGNYNSNADGYEDKSFLLKLDTAGNVIWQKLNQNNVSTINKIEIDLLDSGFYYPYGYNWSPWLCKVDKYGEFVWAKQFNTILSSPYKPSNPFDITFVDSNTMFLGSVGYRQSGPSTIYMEYIVITSFNIFQQSINWEKKYRFDSYIRNITLEQSIGVNHTLDGNIAISSTIIHPDSEVYNRGTILLINQNGDSLWQRYYAHNWDDSSNIELQLNDLIVSDDGGFLFGGFVKDYGDGKVKSWLVKTDSLGMTKAAFTLGVKENTLVIKKIKPLLYPNPATDNFNIRLKKNPINNYKLSIYSSSGTLLKQKNLSALNNEYRVNIKDLKPGVYLVKLVSENHIIYSQKIIKN